MKMSTKAALLILCLGCQESDAPTPTATPTSDAGARADATAALDASTVFLPGLGDQRETAALSCESLASDQPDLGNGVYWINPVGGSIDNAFAVYCDLEAEDGPWTLIVKIDGHETTFKYDEPIWVNQLLIDQDNPTPGTGEMKNKGYLLLPFTSIRIGMRVDADEEEGDGQTRYLSIAIESDNMRQLMVRGDEYLTEFGRATWRQLIPLTSLQPNCNAEGINVRHRLRFGLLGNEQDDCHTPDSFIGIGSDRDQVIAGNFAVGRWQSDQGDRRTKAYAELWIKNAKALESRLP